MTEIQPHTGQIDTLPPAQPLVHDAVATLMRHAQMMDTAHELAQRVCRTEMCPATYRGNPDAAMVAIMHGAELGLGPLAALQSIFVVYGRPTLESRTMVALLEQRGYRIQTVEASDESVTVEGVAPTGKREMSTWTIEKARMRGYVAQKAANGQWVKNEKGRIAGNTKYLTDPEAMLWAKAAAIVCRRLAPHVLLGLPYTREEIESESDWSDRVESERPEPARTVARPRGLAGIDQARAERAGPEPKLVVDIEPERPSGDQPSDDQLRTLAALLTEGGATDVGQRRRAMSGLLGRQIGGARDVTVTEVADLVGVLSEAQRDGTLAGVVGKHVGAVLPAEPDDAAALDDACEVQA